VCDGGGGSVVLLCPARSTATCTVRASPCKFEHRGFFADLMTERINCIVREREGGQAQYTWCAQPGAWFATPLPYCYYIILQGWPRSPL